MQNNVLTNNAHKIAEVKAVLGEGYELVTLKEVGITEDIPETGATLDENASLKARYAIQAQPKPPWQNTAILSSL